MINPTSFNRIDLIRSSLACLPLAIILALCFFCLKKKSQQRTTVKTVQPFEQMLFTSFPSAENNKPVMIQRWTSVDSPKLVFYRVSNYSSEESKNKSQIDPDKDVYSSIEQTDEFDYKAHRFDFL